MKKLIALLFMWNAVSATIPQNPSVVIVFVIDQFPFYYLTRHQNNFKYTGFSRFIDKGVFYTNALQAHGIPETSPGHASLSTGVLPVSHGVASNRWFDADGKTINFSHDPDEKTAVISAPPEAGGRSPLHLDVDTVSDQMGMHQATKHICKSFSVGIKDTATIATAGQKTPAFWFNNFQGGFTSSYHYMRELPRWVKQFNERSGIRQLKKVAWPLCFDRDDAAYDYPFIDNYQYAGYPFKLAGREDIEIDRGKSDPYDLYIKTPAANQLVLDFAQACIKNVYKKRKHEKLLLWVCLSPLDLAGHRYGPDSLEIIDFIHHLDRQLDHCMTKIERMLDSNNVAFVLAADHGIQPMQEISKLRGIAQARRIMANDLMQRINTQIEETYRVPNFLAKFESTYFMYNKDAVAALESNDQLGDAENLTKELLLNEPGIKSVWAYHELKTLQCEPNSHEQFYKNHLFSGRLGDLIVQPKPYCLITNYPTGCSHNTPYRYDTQIPLAFYQKGITPQHIKTRVFAAQLAPTIAQMLNTPAPSAALLDPLPHLLTDESK